ARAAITGIVGAYFVVYEPAAPTPSPLALHDALPIAAAIGANSPTTQSAPAGSAVGSPPSVIVHDGSGNPVQGVTVTFAAAAGSGSVTGGTQTTNGSGIATVGGGTLSTTAGTNTLTATSSGLAGSPVTFTADGTAGAAGRGAC